MMTLGRGSRGDARTPEQTATQVAVDALIVTTVPTSGWADPAASASGAHLSASSSPQVELTVAPAADGLPGTLHGIAAGTRDADSRHHEAGTLGKRQN